jgi:ubiquinone/menaquinone biosynthesis C-methylase UbiE
MIFLNLNQPLTLRRKSFDIIISQSSFQHVESKIEALEETHRLLTNEGVARINLQENALPNSNEIGPRLEIWGENGKKITFKKYMQKFKNLKKVTKVIVITKTLKLNFGLEKLCSIPMKKLNKKLSGMKTIYAIQNK